MTQIDYARYVGMAGGPPDYHILMVLNGGGRVSFKYDGIGFDAEMLPGDIGFRLPRSPARSSWPSFRLLQISIDPGVFGQLEEEATEGGSVDLEAAAGRAYRSLEMRRAVLQFARSAKQDPDDTLAWEERLVTIMEALVLSQQPAKSPGREQPLSGVVLRRVMERIHDAPDWAPSVQELAGLAGQSRSHFCRAFKRTTGQSPASYIAQIRMSHAANRIRSEDISILNIALDSGYSNPSKFAAVFRRHFGLTPVQWRDLY